MSGITLSICGFTLLIGTLMLKILGALTKSLVELTKYFYIRLLLRDGCLCFRSHSTVTFLDGLLLLVSLFGLVKLL